MEWAMAVVAVAVLAIGAVAATGRLGGMAEEPVRDSPRHPLPPHPLGEEDVTAVRLGVALRGYSMTEVDELLERLAREVGERDDRIADLEHQLRTQDVHLGSLERERDERQLRPSDRETFEPRESPDTLPTVEPPESRTTLETFGPPGSSETSETVEPPESPELLETVEPGSRERSA